MKRILLLLAILFGNMLSASVIEQADIDEQNALSGTSYASVARMQDFFDDFADKMGIKYGQTENGKTFYYGKASIILKPNDPEFALALSNGFNKAMSDLQFNYIRDTFGKTTTEKLMEYSNDSSTNARDFPPIDKQSKMSQILDKIASLAGSKIDEMLAEYGIKSEQLSIEQKKTLFEQQFLIQTMTKAFGNMRGLVPIATKVSKNKMGVYEIGVIAVISEKTIQIATDMSLRRKPIVKGNGKPVREFLPKTDKELANEYGIRLVYDENQSPVILSYANWGYVPQGNDILDTQKQEIAFKQAQAQADAAIAEFVNLSVQLSSKTTSGEELKNEIKRITKADDSTQDSESEIRAIINKFTQNMKANASVQNLGIRTLKSWDYTDENGHEYVGVVRFYSYLNAKIPNNKVNNGSNARVSSPATKETKQVQRNSKVVNSLDDF